MITTLLVKNSLDVEAPFSQQRAMHLKHALSMGQLEWADVKMVYLGTLPKQPQFDANITKPKPGMSIVFHDEHRELVREVAQCSVVLLKNDKINSRPLLRLKEFELSSIALLGRPANVTSTGDYQSSRAFYLKVFITYEGLVSMLPDTKVLLSDSNHLTMQKPQHPKPV